MAEVEGGEWVLVGRHTEERPLKVVFLEPAKHWTDAVPIGNGSLGAMVWGGVQTELIQLNHDTLWTGVPGNYTNPQAPGVLSKVRELVDAGKYAEATAAAFDLSGYPSEVYQPLGDIKLDFGKLDESCTSYIRELDLDKAMVTVKYAVGDVEFIREHFASNPHQVIASKISANKPSSVSFTVSLDSKLQHQLSVNDYGPNQIIMNGSCPANRIAPEVLGDPKGIQFDSILDLQISPGVGTISILDNTKLRVEGSDWAVLLLVASSSFDGPFVDPKDSSKDPISASKSTMSSIRSMSFSQLYAHHLDDYQELFHRVKLQLSKSSKANQRKDNMPLTDEHNDFIPTASSTNEVLLSTAERVASFRKDEDPSFVELLFQFGRYLLISCSRPGTQASNLQGIWNKDVSPAWDGAPHLNINLQMNYWPCLSCNLSECQQPLFDFISCLAVNGSKTAKVNYEASGWVAHQVSDIWAKTSPDRGDPVWAMWPMGGAWLCTHLWEHYEYTMDKNFLEKKAYPLLEGCASFLMDWLIEGPGKYLETNPSSSPEHEFISPDGKKASVSYSSTMDIAIIREVFNDVLSAAEVLGTTKSSLVERITKAMKKLPPTRIARDGSIMEWAQDFEDPDVHHRHVSHLFGLFPGHTITLEKTPDLCKAVDYSLYKRGDAGPGWSTTWKMALWAHLQNSKHAFTMIRQLIFLVDPDHEADFEGGLYSNLFTAHPPFQIDANFGFAAVLAEMFVQSSEQNLYLLPALPRDKWGSGYVKGLKARGGVTVSISWNEGELNEANISSKNQNLTRRLHYNGIIRTVKLSTGNTYFFNSLLNCLRVQSIPQAGLACAN